MRKIHIPYIPYRSLLLSTTVLNDIGLDSILQVPFIDGINPYWYG